MILVGIVIAVFAIAAVACSDDNGGDGNGGGDLPGVLQLIATLTEQDASGVSGVADISVNGDGILVQIVMAGLSEGEHANHIHGGSCAEQGAVEITLDQIVADANGDGSQTTNSTEEGIDHFAVGHYVAVHAEDGTVISCGDVVGVDA